MGRVGALRGARDALESAALVTPRDRAIEQHVVGRLPVEREARGEGLPALLAGDVIAVERSQRRRQARAVVGLVAREAAALAFPGHARADRCDKRRHDLDIDLAEHGEAERRYRLWIVSGFRAPRRGALLERPTGAGGVLRG